MLTPDSQTLASARPDPDAIMFMAKIGPGGLQQAILTLQHNAAAGKLQNTALYHDLQQASELERMLAAG